MSGSIESYVTGVGEGSQQRGNVKHEGYLHKPPSLLTMESSLAVVKESTMSQSHFFAHLSRLKLINRWPLMLSLIHI